MYSITNEIFIWISNRVVLLRVPAVKGYGLWVPAQAPVSIRPFLRAYVSWTTQKDNVTYFVNFMVFANPQLQRVVPAHIVIFAHARSAHVQLPAATKEQAISASCAYIWIPKVLWKLHT